MPPYTDLNFPSDIGRNERPSCNRRWGAGAAAAVATGVASWERATPAVATSIRPTRPTCMLALRICFLS